MECDEILKKLCAELAEDINSEICGRIHKHLETCPDCTQQLDAMRNTVNLFHCLQDKVVPQHIHDRLSKLLNV